MRAAHPHPQLFLILSGRNRVRFVCTEYRILGFQLLSFRPLKICAHVLRAPLLSLTPVSLVPLLMRCVIFLLRAPSEFPFFFGFQQSYFDVPGGVFIVFILLGFIVFLEPVVWCLSSWKILHHYLFNLAFVPFSLALPTCREAVRKVFISVYLLLLSISHRFFSHASV